jgi:hypothetical protein
MQAMAEDDFADILCLDGDFIDHRSTGHPSHADGIQGGWQGNNQQQNQ